MSGKGTSLTSLFQRLEHSALGAAVVTLALLGFMVLLGYLAWQHADESNIGSAGSTAVSVLLGAMISPKSQDGSSGSQFDVPRAVWVFLVMVAIALSLIGGYLIIDDSAKYVNAAAALLAGLAAIGGLLVSPAKLMSGSPSGS